MLADLAMLVMYDIETEFRVIRLGVGNAQKGVLSSTSREPYASLKSSSRNLVAAAAFSVVVI